MVFVHKERFCVKNREILLDGFFGCFFESSCCLVGWVYCDFGVSKSVKFVGNIRLRTYSQDQD